MKSLKPLYVVSILVSVGACYLPVFLCSRQTIAGLVMEDHLVEWTGTIACLVAFVAFLIGYCKSATDDNLGTIRTRRNLFLLFLSLMLFVALGEELSWGQRLFHFATPALVSKDNLQHETNFHNLKWFMLGRSSGLKWLANPQTLFTLFWGAYGFFVPLLFAFSKPFAAWTRKVHLPIVPLSIGIGLVANMVLWMGIVTHLPGKGGIEEFQETVFEILMAMTAICFLVDQRNRGEWAKKPEQASQG